MLAALAIYLVVGVAAGLVAGLLGVGGGIVIVPLLLVIFSQLGYGTIDILFPLAAGTSLAVIVPTSMSSAWAHHRNGNVRWRSALAMTPGGLLAVHVASEIANVTAGSTLRTAFGALLVVVSLQMLFLQPKPRPGDPPLPAWVMFLVIGLLSGAVSYFFGVGGGIAAVPLLVILGRLPIHQAVGTSSALVVVLAVYGTIRNVILGQQEAALPPYSWGYVNLLAAACLIPTSILMARVGANLANVASATLLRRLFAALVGIEGVRMALL